MKKTITDIRAFSLLDSRGNPTVGVHIEIGGKYKGFAIAPSGASTGKYEAVELRDGDKNAYFGKGVQKAVENVNTTILDAVMDNQPQSQKAFDELLITLDGTENKGVLGANATLACSLAFAKATAVMVGLPLYRYLGGILENRLPTPMMNILNGGAHAGNNVDIQEFMIVPIGFDTFSEKIKAGCEIYATLGKILKENGKSCGVGDEGGFAPDLDNDRQVLDLICQAIKESGYTTNQVKIALDVASSEWATDSVYHLKKAGITLSSDQLIERIKGLCTDYPIISVEDGMGEDDILGWKNLTKSISGIMTVGDDLFVTNKQRLLDGISQGYANSILIKPNQIGTLSETLEVISLAKQNGYTPIISHRSGESEDSFIADLAVAVGAPFIKTGAPCRSERTAKYNRLLLIEKEI